MQAFPNNQEVAEELKYLVLKIQTIGEEIKTGIRNMQNSKIDCELVNEWQGEGNLMIPQYVRNVCKDGYPYFKNMIQDPLLKSLLDYRDHLLGTKAYTGDFKTKIKGLLSSIHRYVIVSSFFGRNTHYLAPRNDIESINFREESKKIILETNMRLMGCDDEHKFPIRNMATRVGMDTEHAKILEYMRNQCLFLRKELLK
jgi:hypothetical protein